MGRANSEVVYKGWEGDALDKVHYLLIVAPHLDMLAQPSRAPKYKGQIDRE